MKKPQSRRDFLRLSAAGALGAIVISQSGCGNASKPSKQAAQEPVDPKSFGLGLQLYTIRDAMAADVPGSLKKVSDYGYKYVELADYTEGKFYGYTPAEFKKLVNDLGMEIISSHTQVEGAGVTLESAKKMAEDHALIGAKYCIQPWIVEEMRTSIASYQRMAANWNEIGKIMKDQGLQFGYHNHNFEFATVEGKVPYFDVMLAELDKDLVIMELDMFWTNKAGHNPVDIFNKYPGRFPLYHLKDMYTQQPPFFEVIKDDIAPVGEGVINFKEIIAARDIAGMKYMIVEQDETRGDMFADIQKSITNLTTKILV
ncbi:MAG TPA: sugar phosphate isomerase/epimerase [Bacteroidales bacterium]|jgi:sugar phosphate isomerase/epimerase|nr:sugar phosphate isomerase/epimerase [Bacteroidales bacterium]